MRFPTQRLYRLKMMRREVALQELGHPPHSDGYFSIKNMSTSPIVVMTMSKVTSQRILDRENGDFASRPRLYFCGRRNSHTKIVIAPKKVSASNRSLEDISNRVMKKLSPPSCWCWIRRFVCYKCCPCIRWFLANKHVYGPRPSKTC